MDNLNPVQQESGGIPPQVPQVNPQSSSMGELSINPQATPGGGQVVSEEQKQELRELLDNIRKQLEHVKAVNFAAEQKTEAMRKDLLKQVFEKLQLAGVDLKDQASVAEFIAKLRARNPEMADNFEEAMNVLLGEEGMPEEEMPEEGMPDTDVNMNNENPNEALPENSPGYM